MGEGGDRPLSRRARGGAGRYAAGMAVRRVIVVRFGSVGDIVLAGGAVAALREAWPDARVCFVTRAAFVDVAASLPGVDEVMAPGPAEGLRAFAARLAAGGLAGILDLHTSLRSWLLRFWLPRVPTGVWRRRSRWGDLLVRLTLRRMHSAMSVASRYHAAVEALVGGTVPKGRLGLKVGTPALAAIEALLDRHGVPRGARRVVLVPGANWATKRWPAERFATLARRCLAEGVVPVVVGGPGEGALTAAVVSGAPGAIDLGEVVSLAELPALLVGSSAVVAHDSGPMHMARALRVPTLAVFGSTDPAPFDFTGHAVHAAPPPCAPCHPYGRARCPKGHMRCLLALPAEPAEPVLTALLGARRPDAPEG